MSVKIITENLKSKQFGSLYYILGEEEYLKSYYYNELKQKSVSELPEFNVIEFDGKKLDWLDFCNCVNSYPVMAERKFVGVVNFNNSMLQEKFLNQFVEFLKSIPDFCTVVFYDNELKPSDDQNPLKDAIDSVGGVVADVQKPALSGLVSWCARHFKQAKKQISTNDINYMLSIADTDMRSLDGEITKLCNYCKGDVIERADIDAVVTKSIEANRYEIGAAFCAKNYDKVLDIVDKLYKQNVNDLVIFNTIYSAFVDMYKVKLAMSCQKTAQQAASELGMYPFVATKAAKQSAALTLEFLESAILLSKEVDIKLKSKPFNNRDVITFYIAELIDRRNTVAKA